MELGISAYLGDSPSIKSPTPKKSNSNANLNGNKQHDIDDDYVRAPIKSNPSEQVLISPIANMPRSGFYKHSLMPAQSKEFFVSKKVKTIFILGSTMQAFDNSIVPFRNASSESSFKNVPVSSKFFS